MCNFRVSAKFNISKHSSEIIGPSRHVVEEALLVGANTNEVHYKKRDGCRRL